MGRPQTPSTREGSGVQKSPPRLGQPAVMELRPRIDRNGVSPYLAIISRSPDLDWGDRIRRICEGVSVHGIVENSCQGQQNDP